MFTPATVPRKTLSWALLGAGLALSDAALAAEAAPPPAATDLVQQWAQLVVYAITPYCQALSNGLRVCQPVGLVGPAPNSPAAAYQPLVQVPLAPPTLQPPGVQPFALPPHNPYLPAPAMPLMPWQAAPVTPAPQPQAPVVGVRPQVEPTSSGEPAAAAAVAALPPTEPATKQAVAADTISAPATAPAPLVTAAGPAGTPAAAEATAAVARVDTAIAYFEFDRAELNAAGRAALDTWLARYVKGTRIVVTGHADRLGPAGYNLDLSRRRAEAARDYLVQKGVDPRLITIVAMGERQPVKHCKGRASPATIACLAPNRRVVIEP